MTEFKRELLSGNEAIALAALHCGVALGAGYPGTPSTEILEYFSEIGGSARWSPNEKVALEVGIGAAFAGARSLVTMKHVGLNVAADPLFTVAYSGVDGALIIVVADDPGMASSQNEQDSRRYAVAAGVPMLEPSSSQDAYDLFFAAVALSEKYQRPVLFRVTTRICHSKTVVKCREPLAAKVASWRRDVTQRVMVPSNARPAHHLLRRKLEEVLADHERSPLNVEYPGEDRALGIIASGISAVHASEAAPGVPILHLATTYPLPVKRIRDFVASVGRCVVIEEGDPYMAEAIAAEGILVEAKAPMYRFGELNVERVERILKNEISPEPVPPPGKPPMLCTGCPHRLSFETLRDLNCIVTGDIGCYTLGVLPPFEAMDTCVCMGASIGVGLGLRHVLEESEARRVVSVLGDSTFMHSGLTGLLEMVYNRPATGHVVMVLDNGITAMTGLQEHPGTGRLLDHSQSTLVDIAAVARAIGMEEVIEVDPVKAGDSFVDIVRGALDSRRLVLILVRRPCLLLKKQLRRIEEQNAAGGSQCS